jgi:hypothetical protein
MNRPQTDGKLLILLVRYKELCINVNGQEECGFKEVSTSFAINVIKNIILLLDYGSIRKNV